MFDKSLASFRAHTAHTQTPAPRHISRWLLTLLLGFASGVGTAQAAVLDVALTDAANGAPLAAQSVAVYEKSPSGTLTWKRGGTTDANGRVTLEVSAPASGNHLVARTRPFAMWIEQAVGVGGNVSIRAGLVRAQVLNGVTGAPFVGAPIVLGTRDGEGKFLGITTVTTDAAGQVRLDPNALGTQAYFLRGDSPVDGSRKYSDPITAAGNVVFRVGNPAVTVNLTNFGTEAPLAAQRVEVRERLKDGTLIWIAAHDTDGNGRAKFDLDGLDDGRRYVVRVKPYLQNIEREITAAGWIGIRAGTVPSTILNGDTGAPLANAEVVLYKRTNANAPWQYEFKSTTGADGKLVFDPVHLGEQQYALRAASPVDGSLKYSTVLSSPGPLTFAVGNRRLTVKVVDARNDAVLAALKVIANEVRSDGTLAPGVTRTTDADGTARFDLDGLGKGKRYRIRTTPFLQTIERDITSTGWLDIKAGVLRVRVENGANGATLGAREVKLYKLLADGSRKGTRTLTTARDGSLVLDPVDLGSTRYQLSAVSPFDGSTKFSQIFQAGGDAVFSVGGAGVTVRVKDWKSGAAMAGQAVGIYERKVDGSLVWAANRATDATGQVRFDLDGVGAGRRYVARVKAYLQWIERDIAANGLLEIRAGNLRVAVKRGDNGLVYPSAAVKLLAVRADGEYEGIANFITPANGELALDLPDLGSVRYVLRAPSPIDGSLKYSPVVSTAGQIDFAVGNKALNVHLVDFQSRAAIGGTTLQVYELNADGNRSWVTQRATDAAGKAAFDLDGLGKGRRYVVRARPFAQWLEHMASTTGDALIEGGRATVQLIDVDNNRAMSGIEVQARAKSDDGSLSGSVGTGVTDANGQIRFDPPSLGNGGVAVFTALNPFENGVNYYSSPSIETGLTRFEISRTAGPRRLDRTPAELSVAFPRVGQRVSLDGIMLTGQASDDMGLREVAVEILNGTALIGRYLAGIDKDTHRWILQSPALGVSNDTQLVVRVLATDMDYNVTLTQFSVVATRDTTPPTLLFRTPTENALTDGRSLLVIGNVRDDTQWRAVEVQLEQGARTLAPYRTVEIDTATGDWSFAIPSDLMKEKASLTIRARGTDIGMNASESTRTISFDPDSDPVRHLLSRMTYGENPALLDEVKHMGYTAFVDQQLSPTSIDDSALDARLSSTPITSSNGLRRDILIRASESRRQLNEVLTWFWDNHFNTDFNRHGRFEQEVLDNAAFRQRALGRFRDLLEISARSFSMLVYLDNAQSHKNSPNENYARELLELHTMGSGYTQRDVEEVARAFTGWTVKDGRFVFASDRHDDGEKIVLGQILPAGGGEKDGSRILDILSNRPETARHLCRKLATRLVSEAPSDSLIMRCSSVFLNQHGAPNQIAQVVRSLLTSAEFRAAPNRGSMVKDSIRFLIGAIRATEALRNGNDLPQVIANLSQPLLTYPAPDGYAMDSASWSSPYLLRTRLEFIGTLIENPVAGTSVTANPRVLLHGWPMVTTAEGIAARVLQNLNAGSFDSEELAIAIAALTEGGTRQFRLDTPYADAALRRLVRIAMSLPRYQMY